MYDVCVCVCDECARLACILCKVCVRCVCLPAQ